MDRVQMVVQQARELTLSHRSAVRVDEVRAEEGQDQRSIRLARQPPRTVALIELVDLVVVHPRRLSASEDMDLPPVAPLQTGSKK